MREIEMASASSTHLYFQHGQLHMLLPAHKSSSQGELTTRALYCGCAVRRQPLCPWHAGARHLQRLEILQAGLALSKMPLFPDDRGRALSKSDMISTIRETLQRAGVHTTRQDEAGLQVERFTGHVLRVAGTQHLYLLGLRFDMVQLHGRWSSFAVQKYLQAAPLLLVPGTVARALVAGPPVETAGLGGVEGSDPRCSCKPSVGSLVKTLPIPGAGQPRLVACDPSPSLGPGQSDQADRAQREVQSCLPHRADADLAALRLQFTDFKDRHGQEATLIVNARSKRAHLPDEEESSVRPELWATACGILYGNTRFFRTSASRPEWPRCKRCFPPEGQTSSGPEAADDDQSSGGDTSSSLSSSSSSSSD